MQTNSWHHKLFHFHLSFWKKWKGKGIYLERNLSGKGGKEGKKLQIFEYLKNDKSFLDEIKNTFHSF